MPIDPSIPLSVKPLNIDIMGAYQNALAMQDAQTKRQVLQQKMQRQNQLNNFLSTANLDDPAVRNKLASLDPEKASQVEQMYSHRATASKAEFETALAKFNDFRRTLGGLAAANNGTGASYEQVQSAINESEQRGIIKPEVAEFYRRSLPRDPAQLQAKLRSGATELAEPNHIVSMFGMTANERSMAEDRAVGRTETERHNRAMEKAAQDKGVDINAYPNVYQAVADGRIPLARVNSRTAAIFEGVLSRNPDADLNAIGLDQTSATAGARTAGATQANIGIASDEANRMIGVTRSLIPQVKATDFPSLNALKNAISRGTGDPNIVALNTSLNSLINSYARAINPKGVATVSDKNHARELIDSAMANGQLDAALNVMQREMEAALGAARASSGRQKPKPSATAPATAPTDGVDHSNPLLSGKP